MKKVKPFRYVYLALMLLFLYLPIIYLIVFSFNDFSTGRRVSYANLGRWNGFTLEKLWINSGHAVCARCCSRLKSRL